MKFKETVGIDISKDVIDVTLHLSEVHQQFENKLKGFKAFVKWLKKNASCSINEVLICFEHTGIYSLSLATFLSENNYKYVIESALQIKRSLGLTRGKNDKIDSKRIAEYAFMRKNTLKTYDLPSMELQNLQSLLSLRTQLVKQRAGLKARLKEQKLIMKQKDNLTLFNIQDQTINHLSKQINKIEKEMKSIIDKEPQLKKIYKLVTSVIGIGLVIGVHLLVSTNCFTKFDNARKYACYCGVAPFEHSSGKSIKGKTRVSHYADKELKTLFDLAAKSAILYDPELKSFYQGRVDKGKSKMSSINAVRNKLIHRVFAVIKRESPYVPLFRPNLAA